MKDEEKKSNKNQELKDKELNEVNGGRKDYSRIRFDKKMEQIGHLKY